MKYTLKIQDIAVKQLESAIWMYAYNYDEVAVHTISAAAFELYTKRLKLFDFKANMQQFIKADRHKEFMSMWNRPYNVFKHGEHAHEEVDEITYEEDTVDILIYLAAEANLIGPEEYRLNCAKVFKIYFIINNPDLIDKAVFEEVYLKAANDAGIPIDRLKGKESLRLMLETIGHTFTNGTNSPYRDIDKKSL